MSCLIFWVHFKNVNSSPHLGVVLYFGFIFRVNSPRELYDIGGPPLLLLRTFLLLDLPDNAIRLGVTRIIPLKKFNYIRGFHIAKSLKIYGFPKHRSTVPELFPL